MGSFAALRIASVAGFAVVVPVVLAAVIPTATHSAMAQPTGEHYTPTDPIVILPLPNATPEKSGADPLTSPPAGAGAGAVDARQPKSVEEIEKIIEQSPPPVPAGPDRDAENAAAGSPTFRGASLTPKMTWRLENAFRFFTDPADTEVHRATFEALTGGERRNPVLAAERALATRHGREGWAASMADDTCWDAEVNQHRCNNRADYLMPQAHVVRVALDGIAEAATVACSWSSVPRGKTTIAPTSVLQPCDQELRLEVPYPDGADVSVSIGGVELQRTRISVTDLLIVGMGDSFASGEGNPDVPVRFSRERDMRYGGAKNEATATGFPARVGSWQQIGDKGFIEGNARWLDQACHRSLYSHQLRAALQLAIEAPHRAVTYVGLACSGAEITDGLFLRYKGNEWVPNPPELSQISAAAVAQCDKNQALPQDLPEAYHIKGAVPELGGLVLYKCPVEHSRKIDLVMASIGGNDIGFARLLANAILSDQSTLRKLGGWFGQVHGLTDATGLIATLDERYKALNRALHNILHIPWNESDRILLTGYPGLALLGDGSQVCPDGTAGMDVVNDFRLSNSKAREGVWISDKLNRIMQKSAAKHGWTFVDHHRREFVDRGICAGFTDNAFSIADDLRMPRKINGVWSPYNPADFPPYASRQRWFRTPNDAFMTGNFHVSQSILQKALKFKSLSFFQLVLAATYSGAFHPTAEGHAAIADAVVEQARAVLERYGQGQEPRTPTDMRLAR